MSDLQKERDELRDLLTDRDMLESVAVNAQKNCAIDVSAALEQLDRKIGMRAKELSNLLLQPDGLGNSKSPLIDDSLPLSHFLSGLSEESKTLRDSDDRGVCGLLLSLSESTPSELSLRFCIHDSSPCCGEGVGTPVDPNVGVAADVVAADAQAAHAPSSAPGVCPLCGVRQVQL